MLGINYNNDNIKLRQKYLLKVKQLIISIKSKILRFFTVGKDDVAHSTTGIVVLRGEYKFRSRGLLITINL